MNFSLLLLLLLQQLLLVLSRDSLYNMLGLKPNASIKEIKKAYRKLAIFYHPDKNKDSASTDKFIQISNAYKILTHPLLKLKYDNNDETVLSFIKLFHQKDISLEDIFPSYFKDPIDLESSKFPNRQYFYSKNNDQVHQEMLDLFSSQEVLGRQQAKKQKLSNLKKLIQNQPLFNNLNCEGQLGSQRC